MTVLSTENSYIQYTTNGERKYFEYGFVRYPGDTILVYLNDKRFYDFTEQAKGIVIKPAPKKGTLIIAKETPITQERDFTAFDSFDASWTEDAMDKLILLKQQAARFRAFINLDAVQYLNYTVIDNDKGSDGVIYLWNNERSGVFSGEVTPEMPPAGSATYKPENFVWLQYGDTEILTEELTTTLYPIEATEQATFGISMGSASMGPIPLDEVNFTGTITGAEMLDVLLDDGPYDDSVDFTGTIMDVILLDILLSDGPYDDVVNFTGTMTGAEMLDKLVSVYSPDEETAFVCTMVTANCSMTPI